MLKQTSERIAAEWVKLCELRKNKTEAALLIERNAGDVRKCEAMIIDQRTLLLDRIDKVLDEFQQLYPPATKSK